MKILVTGGSGFIGSRILEILAGGGGTYDSPNPNRERHTVRSLVRNTNQKNLRRLNNSYVNRAIDEGRLEIHYGDLLGDITGICEGVDWVIHTAAKTFVDHSIKDPATFIMSNVVGTHRLLEDARQNKVKKFIHVSTDEVYGPILKGKHKEDARINPTNPYSAAKAGADALTISYAHSYGMNTLVTRTENNYGPYQHPQKVLPVFVKKAIAGKDLPVYGDGKHSRQWLHVSDHVDALLFLLEHNTKPGDVVHIAGHQEVVNIDLAKTIIKILQEWRPNVSEDQIKFIPDHDIRPGHDRRYALDSTKINQMGWAAKQSLEIQLRLTIQWYMENYWWTE